MRAKNCSAGRETGALLVVDDNDEIRVALSRRLEMAGHSVVAAENGTRALELVEQHPFDLVLLDVAMPDISGIEVLKILRKTCSEIALPIIMVTSRDESGDIVEALNLGANDYMTKPIDIPVLFARIQVHLSLRRGADALREAEEALRKAHDEMEKRVDERTADLKAANVRLQREIAERKRAEETLSKLARAIEQVADAVVITDKNGVIEYVNPAFVETTGYTAEEAIGRTPRILKSGEHGEDLYKKLWATILAGRAYRVRFTNRKKNGELFYVEHTITPMKDDQGNITHFVSVWKDVTEQRKADEERRQLERQLVQSERMASVGTVAAGIVHNLKNPLVSIQGFAELIQIEHPDLDWAGRIVSSARQMDRMIGGILDKSRHRKNPEPVDLNLILARELDFLQADPVFKHEVETDVRFAEDLPPVEGVYTDFSQVFGNLLRNAVDAMHGRQTKRLAVVTSSDAGHVTVEVTDTGSGIPEANIPHLFEPFFTTKSPDTKGGGPVGTGLGLFTVQRILGAYRAEVDVESTVETGTTFRVKIPVCGAPVEV